MNKVKISILLAALVVTLITTSVVSAAPMKGSVVACSYAGGVFPCQACQTGYYGWYCYPYDPDENNPDRNYGDIEYKTSYCGYDYWSNCDDEICHCMVLGTPDHCESWQH